MGGFLTFIFWCIVIFWLLGIVGRLLLRGFINRASRQYDERTRAARSNQRPRTRTREGEVRVENLNRKEKKVDGSVGEYVDYEEIKEQR